MSKEKCQRCGEIDYDRRTLRMSCFYEMDELGIPFDKSILFFADTDKMIPGKQPVTVDAFGKQICIQSGTVKYEGELRPEHQYTLTVCKDCRALWLQAIKDWFNNLERVECTDTPTRFFGTNK